MREARVRIAGKTKIDLETGCWEWTGNPRENGYCRTTYKRNNWYVHRLSFAAFVGPIPVGLDVCHKCDNRRCCNPGHLFIGTRKDNMADAVKKGRQAKGEKLSVLKRGELSPSAKLREKDVIKIRERFSNGCTTKALSTDFNVSVDNIRRIVRRDTWRHI